MKAKNLFKAVEFMRKVRNDMSLLFKNDKKRFHEELKQAMANFIANREKLIDKVFKKSKY